MSFQVSNSLAPSMYMSVSVSVYVIVHMGARGVSFLKSHPLFPFETVSLTE